ncbi:MAG: hypothetical protein WBX22_01615 [Silvibacterium sp.]
MKPLATSRPSDETSAALKRLGVSVKELKRSPQITPLLKLADGGLRATLSAMRFSSDPLIRAFFARFDSLSEHDKKHLPLEAVALAAKIDIVHLLGAILLALVAQSINIVKIIAVSHHHRITAARVRFGQLPLGEKDRTALDVAMGFLPSPKGPTFIGKAVFGSAMMQQREADEDEDDDARILREDEIDLEKLFPSPRNMQERLLPIRLRQLPEPDKSQENPPKSQ